MDDYDILAPLTATGGHREPALAISNSSSCTGSNSSNCRRRRRRELQHDASNKTVVCHILAIL
jgi:hypothetical protein